MVQLNDASIKVGVLKSGNGRTKFGGIQHHGLYNSVDEAQKKELLRIHEKHLSSYRNLYANQFAYRKSLWAYLADAEKAGISPNDAINVHKEKIYKVVQELTPDKSCGQEPSAIILAGTSEDHSFEIFSHRAKSSEKHVWAGAAFGVAINIRKEKHISHNGFFESMAYMVKHMQHEGKHVPYALFACDYGTREAQRGATPESEVRLMDEVRRRVIGEWRKSGYIVSEEPGKVPYLTLEIRGKPAKIYMPIVLHDLHNCRYYVVEGDEKSEFSTWAESYGLGKGAAVQAHLEALELHKAEKAYFDGLVMLGSKRKKCNCVDSREEEQQGSAIRLIGGIATAEQRKRILEELDYFTVSLHFGCGYLTTAMRVHEMGREIMLMLREGEAKGNEKEAQRMRSHFSSAVAAVTSGKFSGFDVNGFIASLEDISGRQMREFARKMLHEILGGQTSETREIAKHMYNRGILGWSGELGTLVMPSAAEVDKREHRLLPENRSAKKEKAEKEERTYFERITLEVAKDEIAKWQATLIETESTCKVKVQIKNYENAIVASTMHGTDIFDAITGREIR